MKTLRHLLIIAALPVVMQPCESQENIIKIDVSQKGAAKSPKRGL